MDNAMKWCTEIIWDANSVQGIFTQYERPTKKSGLLLNADKTDILNFENYIEKVYEASMSVFYFWQGVFW